MGTMSHDIEDYQTAYICQRPQQSFSLSAMRKALSTPTLRSLGDEATLEDGMEVYVVLRNFQEFAGGIFHRLPSRLRDGVRDCGVCHYMTVFRQPDGTLVQFDFGPSAGGDIYVSRGPLARLLTRGPNRQGVGRSVEGKVRERRLTALPPAHLYVGRTHLSMADIRAWNSVHASNSYELHRSDCRHYVNSLVQYTTGVERATISALRHSWAQNKHRYGFAECVVRLGHIMTDVANWDKVKAMGHATTGVLMALTGHQALGKLRSTPLLASVQKRLVPVARRALVPVPRAITQRPAVAVGATAVATYAASGGQAPGAVRDTITLGAKVAGGVQTAMRAAVTLVEHVGRSAAMATKQTRKHAVALATGIAGAASKGATNVVIARPRRPALTAAPRSGSTSSENGPLRIVLPDFKGRRAQQLALVASRK